MNFIHLFKYIHTFDNLFGLNSSPILELSVKFASQIYHENTNTPLDGAYLADFGIDIMITCGLEKMYPNFWQANPTVGV